MYLSELRIWNFRKYGYSDLIQEPAIIINFKQGLNVLIGENDSGKTAIIDAIKFILGTKSHDNLKIKEKDFYVSSKGERSKELKIECIFKELSEDEAGSFLEWINFDNKGNIELQVRFIGKIKDNRIVTYTVAGISDLDTRFDACELLRATYLKPLRDAENELSQGYHSRLAQILTNHPLFKKETEEQEHTLEKYFRLANEKVENYFKTETLEIDDTFDIKEGENGAKEITERLNTTLEKFMGIGFKEKSYDSNVSISKNQLSYILKKLSLAIAENQVGLGSLNQLFIALELLLFDIENRYNITLIEELEAHLHPQAQLRVVEFLQEKMLNENLQFIISTHSITLASKIQLDNLILCKDKKAYSLGKEYTKLSAGDYKFLERFLDATKANLFFSKGVIFVEGDAENLLMPVIAKLINLPLEKYGVSVVNVGSLAFMRYTNIYKRSQEDLVIETPLAIVTDLDIKPKICNDMDGDSDNSEDYQCIKVPDNLSDIEAIYPEINLTCISGKYFLNEDVLYLDIKQNNALDSFNKFRGLKDKLLEKVEIVESIDNVIKLKTKMKCDQYETEYAKLYTNNWTLEYDFGLSSLRTYMYAAIRIAKKIKNNEEITININLNEELEEAKKVIDEFEAKGFSKEKIAYLIYVDLYKKNASKAVAAQYLSELLIENKAETQPLLKEDRVLLYLTDAIRHVCELGGRENESSN